MAIQKWQPSTLYLPGSLVIPTAVQGAVPTVIPNADLESGDTGWTKGTGWAINTNLAFNGTYSAEYSGPGAADLENDTKLPVSPGKAITATCFIHQGASDDGQANAAVFLHWYDSGDVSISTSTGSNVSTGGPGEWRKSTVSATAPPNAAKVAIGVSAYNDWAVLNVDGFAWNYITGASATGLAYKAVTGASTSTETPTGVTQATLSFSTGGSFSMPDGTFTAQNAYGYGSSISGADNGYMANTGISPGDSVAVTGSTLNDGTYTVRGDIAAYAFLTEETLIDEGPVSISLVYSGNKIRSNTNFENLGVIVGSKIYITGTASNDGTYTVTHVRKGIMHVSESITIESGVSANISLDGIPDGTTGTSTTGTAEAGGMSGVTEPIWPGVAGITVQDNEVLWEGVASDSVTWEATSILTSGSSEPTWTTTNGGFNADNNIAWEAVPLRIEDENCPHSKVVAIAASKVFAGDTDITRFCATLNARDWSSEDDAGFLPTGLQQKSQVGVDAMGVYRGNLAIWSASTFQVWQVDPDPAVMALLDAMEGIGSMHQQAVQPVSDDLFFLAALGVRTVSIAEGANNLASGDVGVPIDTLVQAEVNQPDVEPIATYYPGAGQYWLAFRPLTIAAALLAGQFLLTSPVYPLEFEDSLINSTSPGRGSLIGAWSEDAIENTTLANRGTKPYVYNRTDFEHALINNTAKGYGTFSGDIVVYNYHEDAEIGDTSVGYGTIEAKLIVYPNEEDALINSTSAGYGTLA